MENEVSGIAKLGIVLIALAVLIGLGFGIFQISKGTANTGVNNVQAELDGVASSTFTTYDQTTITGTMASSAVGDFEGENIAVLISTKAWVNLLADKADSDEDDAGTLDCQGAAKAASGMAAVYGTTGSGADAQIGVPLVVAYNDKDLATGHEYLTQDSKGRNVQQVFVNYNALLGTSEAAGTAAGTVTGGETYNGYNMGCIYFDNNCFRVDCGFMTDASGRVLFNNITGNLSRSGRTEYIPSSGKFDCFLIKDSSGTNMGITMQQL